MILVPAENFIKQRFNIFKQAYRIKGFVRHRKSGKYYRVYALAGDDAFCQPLSSNRTMLIYYENTDGFVYVPKIPEFKEIDWI